MATRKRHAKPQFVIPEEVAAPAPSGWAFRTGEPAASPPPQPASPAPPARLFGRNPVESGMRAFSYSMMAAGQFLLFSLQLAAMPLTVATSLVRRRS